MGIFVRFGWMLFALLAVLVPLIIEWLFRRRKRQVPLPTIRYLLNNKEQEKIRRQDLILLVLRCALLGVLALAISQPLIQRGVFGREQGHDVTIVLDGTASMDQQVDVTTAFGMARRKAATLIRSLPAGTNVSVVLLGDTVRPVVSAGTDLHTVAAKVEALRSGSGAAPMDAAVQWVASDLATRKPAAPEVYVFSDFQKYTWLRQGGAAVQASSRFRELADSCDVYLVDVGGKPAFNYITTLLRPAEYVLAAGMPVKFEAAVECRGTPPPDATAVVTFLVNGVKKDVRTIRPSGQSTPLEFEFRFPGPGEYLMEAVVSGDAYRLDNRRYFLCTVPEDVRVLILDETAAAEAPESTFLARAIHPPTPAGLEKLSYFTVRTIAPERISYENLPEYAVVVLNPTTALGESMVSQLENYVSDGGALWMFMGPSVNLYEYNRWLYQKGKGLLPCRLDAKVVAEAGEPDKAAYPQYGETAHPALAQFAREAGDKDAAFLQYISLAPAAEDTDSRIVLKLSNGTPAIVEKRVGRGLTLVTNTTAGPEWNRMPALSEYLVLVQELLRYLVGRPDESVNLEVGGTFRQPVYVSAQHLLLRMPDGTKVRLAPKQRPGDKKLWYVEFSDTTQQGVYEIEAIEEVLPKRRFVVNQGPEEGDLTRLSLADFADAFGGTGRDWLPAQRSMEEFATEKYLETDVELSPWLLALVAGALAAESLLAWRFGRRRGEVNP